MIRKNKIDVLIDGQWIPVKKKMDYFRLCVLVIILASISTCYLYRNVIWKKLNEFTHTNRDRTAELAEKQNELSSKQLISQIRIDDETLVIDVTGKLYRLAGEKLQLLKSSVVKLGGDERIAGIIDSPQGYILGINNYEGAPYAKFLRLAEGKVTEEKVFYKSVLRDNDMNQNIFLTNDGKVIVRTDTGQYLTLQIPVKAEDIVDYGIFNQYILISTNNSDAFFLDIDHANNEDARWIRFRKGTQHDSDEQGKTLIIKASGENIFLINRNVLERWLVRNGKAERSESISVEDIFAKKSFALADFKMLDLRGNDLIRDRCVANNVRVRCLNVDASTSVFPLGDNYIVASDASRYNLSKSK